MAPATSSINLQPRSSLLPPRNIQQQPVARSPPWYFRETDQRDRAADSSSHWSRGKLIFLELCLLVYNCSKLSDSAWFSLTIFIANFVIHSSLTERSWSILTQPLIFLVVNAKIWFKFRWLLLFIRLHELICHFERCLLLGSVLLCVVRTVLDTYLCILVFSTRSCWTIYQSNMYISISINVMMRNMTIIIYLRTQYTTIMVFITSYLLN